jgi:hypothetical protein
VITYRDPTYECGHQGELAPEDIVHHEHLAAVEVQLLLGIHQQILQSSITTVGLVATRTVNAPTRRGDSTLQSPDRSERDHGDRSRWRRLLVMAVWRRCTRRELEQPVAFGTDHFLGEERPVEATA